MLSNERKSGKNRKQENFWKRYLEEDIKIVPFPYKGSGTNPTPSSSKITLKDAVSTPSMSYLQPESFLPSTNAMSVVKKPDYYFGNYVRNDEKLKRMRQSLNLSKLNESLHQNGNFGRDSASNTRIDHGNESNSNPDLNVKVGDFSPAGFVSWKSYEKENRDLLNRVGVESVKERPQVGYDIFPMRSVKANIHQNTGAVASKSGTMSKLIPIHTLQGPHIQRQSWAGSADYHRYQDLVNFRSKMLCSQSVIVENDSHLENTSDKSLKRGNALYAQSMDAIFVDSDGRNYLREVQTVDNRMNSNDHVVSDNHRNKENVAGEGNRKQGNEHATHTCQCLPGSMEGLNASPYIRNSMSRIYNAMAPKANNVKTMELENIGLSKANIGDTVTNGNSVESKLVERLTSDTDGDSGFHPDLDATSEVWSEDMAVSSYLSSGSKQLNGKHNNAENNISREKNTEFSPSKEHYKCQKCGLVKSEKYGKMNEADRSSEKSKENHTLSSHSQNVRSTKTVLVDSAKEKENCDNDVKMKDSPISHLNLTAPEYKRTKHRQCKHRSRKQQQKEQQANRKSAEPRKMKYFNVDDYLKSGVMFGNSSSSATFNEQKDNDCDSVDSSCYTCCGSIGECCTNSGDGGCTCLAESGDQNGITKQVKPGESSSVSEDVSVSKDKIVEAKMQLLDNYLRDCDKQFKKEFKQKQKKVTASDIVNAEKIFGSLSHMTTSQLPQSRLLALLGDSKRKQLLGEDKKKPLSSEGRLTERGTESVGRAGLGYTPPDTHHNKSKARRHFVENFVKSLSQEAIDCDRKQAALQRIWPQILYEMVRTTVIEMWDGQAYMKKQFDEFEKR